MDAILRCEHAAFRYPDTDGAVLHDLSLSIERGSFTAILGHNGSGKSTLSKLFNAILLPDSGKVYVDDMDTADESHLIDIRRRIGMVFQNPDNQIVSSVVEEDVAFAAENLGVPPEEIRRRVDDALATVGMTEFVRHAPHLLSGGQKQRIAIAGVIAMQPECIVLDEPTAMLDPAGRRDVMQTLHRLRIWMRRCRPTVLSSSATAASYWTVSPRMYSRIAIPLPPTVFPHRRRCFCSPHFRMRDSTFLLRR